MLGYLLKLVTGPKFAREFWEAEALELPPVKLTALKMGTFWPFADTKISLRLTSQYSRGYFF